MDTPYKTGMNLLAHLHLSDGWPVPVAAGNLLADYLRRFGAGLPDAGISDAGFAEGVRLHRAIDAFAEAHPGHRAARAGLSPARRRLGGIIVDVACDFFLSQDWPRYSAVPLREYVGARLAAIQVFLRGHATPLRVLLDRAIAEEWLLAYGTPEGLRLTFERISRRSPAAAPLRGAEEEILRQPEPLRAAFVDFYPALRARFPAPPSH